MSLLVTCDSGGWRTPNRLKARLGDLGLPTATATTGDRTAFLAAAAIARIADGQFLSNEFRPDLVDVGRSPRHRELHGSLARTWPTAVRQAILDEIYFPYRRGVRHAISQAITRSSYVVHLSVRSFATHSPGGQWRRGDVGLAYDPACDDEVDWCLDLIDEMWVTTPELKVRRNHPRRGTHDGLPRAMRRHFEGQPYVGIELLLNQAWLRRTGSLRDRALAGLAQSIRVVTPAMQRAA